jgi:hypothetical protein
LRGLYFKLLGLNFEFLGLNLELLVALNIGPIIVNFCPIRTNRDVWHTEECISSREIDAGTSSEMTWVSFLFSSPMVSDNEFSAICGCPIWRTIFSSVDPTPKKKGPTWIMLASNWKF